MTTHSADAIGTLIDSVHPIVSMERDGLVVIALGSTADADGPAYLTLAEATQEHGIDVHELGGGTLPEVEDGSALMRDGRVVHADVHRVA